MLPAILQLQVSKSPSLPTGFVVTESEQGVIKNYRVIHGNNNRKQKTFTFVFCFFTLDLRNRYPCMGIDY